MRSTILKNDRTGNGIQQTHNHEVLIEELTLFEKEYDSQLKSDINRSFDLSKEYPIRIKFYTVNYSDSPVKTFLLINMHHIASDGWSIGVFEKELLSYYEAYVRNDKLFNLPALAIQYKDYAAWQRSYLTADVLQKQLDYWKEKLSGYSTLEFPTDHTRPSKINYQGSHARFTISKETSAKLRSLAQAKGVTLHSVMLSSFAILLNKYTGQNDIITGTPIANRHFRQTKDLIGFFVNTQVNRTILASDESFEDLIQKVHQDQIEAQQHQDLPFEKLVDELGVERDVSRNPVFQIMFGVQSFGSRNKSEIEQRNNFKFSGLKDFQEIEKFDFSFFIDDSSAELEVQFSYASSLFSHETIVRLSEGYAYLLDHLTADPLKAYSGYSLLSPASYEKIVVEWNATEKEYAQDKTLHELVEIQAEKTPEHIAVVYEGKELTYRELNEKSNQLARYIRAQYQLRTNSPLKRDILIALYLDRGLEMVIGILGVLKAGGAYVPMDTNYPKERIDYMLEDTKSAIILSQHHLIHKASLPADKVIPIDLSEAFYTLESTNTLEHTGQSTDLAYVIYTSGTTGNPKGVMIEHRSAVNTISSLFKIYDGSKVRSASCYTSYVFDVSVSEIFTSLIQGLELHI